MMKEWITLKTKAFKQIYALLKMTHITSSMHVLLAPTGCGKSFTLNYYRKLHPNVYYFKLDKNYSPKEFYIELLHILGVYDYDRTVSLKSLANRVSFLLNENSTKSLVIFDEIGKFSADMLEYFQSIRDATEEHVGIVLAGTNAYQDKFDDWLLKSYRGIPELDSRIFSTVKVLPPSDKEKYAIVKKNGVTEPHEIKRIVKVSTDLRKLYQEVILYRYAQTEEKLEDIDAEKMESV